MPRIPAFPVALAVVFLAAPATPLRAQAGTPVDATNAAGDRILLYPDGRWEYADPAKRAATPKSPPAAVVPGSPAAAGAPAAAPAAATAPTPRAVAPSAAPAPPASSGSTQGGWLFGRRVNEGDPDYNRGSLNPKLR